MKNVLKITMILILILIGFGSISTVYADPSDIYRDPKETQKEIQIAQKKNDEGGIDTSDWNPTEDKSGDKYFKKKVGIVLGVIRAIGIIISVGAIMVIGIKNMVASVEEKSILKQALPGYILGLIMIAGLTIIPGTIYDLIKDW